MLLLAEQLERKIMHDIIYADPPWKQTKGGKRGVRKNQGNILDYPTLSLNEIENILRRHNGKTLFMWAIDKYLIEAHEMAYRLGYKLHARIIWDKQNGVAPAFTVRYSHEYLLWFYKSPMAKISTEMRGKLTTVMREKATRHSKKPECAYRMIEELYPESSKIELFARNLRDGWDSWGNEITANAQVEFQEGSAAE
jgi:N6-adenosine-specific RNA methylase IME4